ncbi:hypothetical protein N9L68_03760 [bacterium]|nr:hypothetical protein [bacterium]
MAACDVRRSVPVCRPCYEALPSNKQMLPTQYMANGNLIGRHPELLRHMPYAHRLIPPDSSRDIATPRLRGYKWSGLGEGIQATRKERHCARRPAGNDRKQIIAFPPKYIGEYVLAIFVGVNPDDTTRCLVATVTKQMLKLQMALLRNRNLVVQSCQCDAEEVAKWSPTEDQIR